MQKLLLAICLTAIGSFALATCSAQDSEPKSRKEGVQNSKATNQAGSGKKSDYEKNAKQKVPKDAFPVFDDPKMTPASQSSLNDGELVIGVEVNGEAKAYPVSVMGRHELGNDVCGDTPITVAW